mgnify:CR=1 FL=1
MGIGGIRALDALGLRPTICHMNEGHSAFLVLERAREHVGDNFHVLVAMCTKATAGGHAVLIDDP